MAKSNENQVLQAIGDYLTRKKYFFFRVNQIPVYEPTRKVFRAMPKYSKKGVPDLILIKDGWFIGLEVKDKGKQSKDQKEFETGCKKAGAEYYLVRSIDDLKEIGL